MAPKNHVPDTQAGVYETDDGELIYVPFVTEFTPEDYAMWKNVRFQSYEEAQSFLQMPFPMHVLEFRPGATWTNQRTGKTEGIALAYVDSRIYMARLDIADSKWSSRYHSVGTDQLGCELTIHGVTRMDVGEKYATDNRATTAAAQALKRAAAQHGLGRVLYDLPPLIGPVKEKGKGKVFDMKNEDLAYSLYVQAGIIDTAGNMYDHWKAKPPQRIYPAVIPKREAQAPAPEPAPVPELPAPALEPEVEDMDADPVSVRPVIGPEPEATTPIQYDKELVATRKIDPMPVPELSSRVQDDNGYTAATQLWRETDAAAQECWRLLRDKQQRQQVVFVDDDRARRIARAFLQFVQPHDLNVVTTWRRFFSALCLDLLKFKDSIDDPAWSMPEDLYEVFERWLGWWPTDQIADGLYLLLRAWVESNEQPQPVKGRPLADGLNVNTARTKPRSISMWTETFMQQYGPQIGVTTMADMYLWIQGAIDFMHDQPDSEFDGYDWLRSEKAGGKPQTDRVLVYNRVPSDEYMEKLMLTAMSRGYDPNAAQQAFINPNDFSNENSAVEGVRR